MSNKRDFHNIIVTMLRDLSAQDHVLQEEGRLRRGGGGCKGALRDLSTRHSVVLVPRLRTQPRGWRAIQARRRLRPRPVSPHQDQPGRKRDAGRQTEAGRRVDEGFDGNWTQAVTEAIRCTWIQTMCGHA